MVVHCEHTPLHRALHAATPASASCFPVLFVSSLCLSFLCRCFLWLICPVFVCLSRLFIACLKWVSCFFFISSHRLSFLHLAVSCGWSVLFCVSFAPPSYSLLLYNGSFCLFPPAVSRSSISPFLVVGLSYSVSACFSILSIASL